MKEINKLTKGKVEIEAYLIRERRKKFITLRGHLPRTNYLDENESWRLLPNLPNKIHRAFIYAREVSWKNGIKNTKEVETIKDVLDYSMNGFMSTRSFSIKTLDVLIEYIEKYGHIIKTHEGK
tara:strand:- start:317 stop:685 length:369 start_codon:yes stop_codon:yes gene_type:complete